MDDLLHAARAGDAHAMARLVTTVESDEPDAAAILRATYPDAGKALIVGVTGPPGGGKSTLVTRLVSAYRKDNARVAVVAVDPSSPFTGGAILGDRIRMREHFLDAGVFIRSMASRGASGGLARATGRVVTLLDAVGQDVILLETVGVGQEEVDVMRIAGTVCLVTVPGLGDDIQAIKAGILEIADVLVVNKADRPGADEAVRDLYAMLSLAPQRQGTWTPPIVKTSASTGDGIPELVSAVTAHAEWARTSGDIQRRRNEAARSEVETVLRETLLRRFEGTIGEERLDAAIARVGDRATDPYSAVEELLRYSPASE